MNARNRADPDRPDPGCHELEIGPPDRADDDPERQAMRHAQGGGAAGLRTVHSTSLHLIGASSYSLRARPEDDGAMWPALAARCRTALPERLAWAAALLDSEQPLPVVCGEPEVREFFHWVGSLPNTERVSIGCERQRPPQGDARA